MRLKLLQGRAKQGGRKECAQLGRGKHGRFCTRARKKQRAGFSALKAPIFHMAHAGEGRSFTGELVEQESRSLLATWRLQLRAFSRKKMRAAIPAALTCVDGAEHQLDHTSWLPAN